MDNRLINKIFVLWFCLIIAMSGFIKRAEAQQYFIKSYSAENGLRTRLVTDACQDLKGYMWFSTYSGISKYDGFSFTSFDTILGLSKQHFRKIHCDNKGIIWSLPQITNQKLVYLEQGKWQSIQITTPYEQGSYTTSFDIFYKDGYPMICIGSYQGLDIYYKGRWKHEDVSQNPDLNRVYSVEAWNGEFYIATKTGICTYSNNKLSFKINDFLGKTAEPVMAVYFEKQSKGSPKLWFLTTTKLGYIYQSKATFVNNSFLLEDLDIVNSSFLKVSKEGNVIFGNNFSKYLLNQQDHKLIPLKVKNGFSSNGGSSAFIDREENIWITDSRGIDKISDVSITNYFQWSGMPENEVTAIAEMAPGKYVLGHNNMLSIYENDKFTPVELPGKPNSITRILDLAHDNDGNIWFSANNLGIGKLSPSGSVKWFHFDAKVVSTSIVQDRNGRIWVGSNKKLFFIRDNKLIEYKYNRLFKSGIRKLYANTDGSIYSTGLNGLWRITCDTAIQIPGIENQALNAFCYYKSKSGKEYAGCINGLYYIKNNKLVKHDINGLSIDSPVYFILEDNSGNLWIGSNNGVYRWSGNGSPDLINPQNGLAGRETNRSAGLLDSQGRVWVGTDRGLSCFSPHTSAIKKSAPVIDLLYAETLDGKKLTLDKPLYLRNNENNLTFHFRGLSFTNEDLIIYRYKLLGYDNEWREATQPMLDKIKYIGLKHGRYKLVVMAHNFSGGWGSEKYSAEIVIRPPFYFTLWFIALVVVVFSVLLWMFYHMASQNLINRTLTKEISERRIAEENLKESEQRLSFVLEGSRLGTWDWDIVTNVVKRNDHWAHMLGYTPNDLVDDTNQWSNLIHPDDTAFALQAINDHLEGKLSEYDIVYRMRTKQNTYRWIHDRAKITQRDQSGKPLRMSGTHTDITEKKIAEDALQKSEERLRLLLASLPVAIYISPVDPKIDLSMITGNVKTLTGFTKEEYMSRPDFFRNRLHPLDHDRVMESFRNAPNEGGLTIEYRWLLADGTYKWFHDQAIVKETGDRKEFLGVIIDINNLKIAEEEIRKKNEMLHQLNAEKDKLFSIISHDLRSPVNGFLGLTALMYEEFDTLKPAQIQEITVALNNSAIKVNDLLNDLLEWSQLQRGIMQFHPEITNLREIAEQCLSPLSEQAKLKNIEIQNQIDSNVTIEADQHMLQVVLRNLLSNAIKFTPKGGKVILQVQDQINGLQVSVSDSGIGMNPDLCRKLFKVSEKTSRKGTEGEPSSGLGLILSREFIEKQNGRIWAESTEGVGSTFYFILPRPNNAELNS